MLQENISLFVNRDCAITYSVPFQKTFVNLEGESELPFGYFDYNSYNNCLSNQWNFYLRNEKNEFQRKTIDGSKIKSIQLKEEGTLLYEITDEHLINHLYLSRRPETLISYQFFYELTEL